MMGVARRRGVGPFPRGLALLSLLWWAAVRAEEKIEPVDAEFLEYLAELEGAEEDWTLFEREEPRRKPSTSKPAEPPPKARAAKPAADEASKQQ
jgi:hypothetical protein